MGSRFEHALHHELKIYLDKFNQIYVERDIELAGNHIRLRFANRTLSDHYFQALQHLEIFPRNQDNPKLTIYVLDAAQLNKKNVTEIANELFKTAYINAGLTLTAPQTSTDHYFNAGYFLYYYSEPMQFGFWIIENIENLSNWHFANPFRFFLYDFLARKKIQASHVAAVGNDHSAVLLAGPSGAGKSTTALACLEENLNFFGDDHCLFSATGTPEVFSLYNSIKIDEKNIYQFPHLDLKPHHHINNAGINKAIFYVNSKKNDCRKKPIKAILKLERSADNTPSMYKISPRETLQSIMLSTLAQCPWVKPKLVIENHQLLAEKVSGYCLMLSKNFEKNTALIRKILDE